MVESQKTNAEIRQWYLDQVSRIPELNQRWIVAGLTVRERAESAWRIRHEARLEARAMMAEPTEVELLRARDRAISGSPDGPTLAFFVEQGRHAGLEDHAMYEAIIEGSYRTKTGITRRLGL